MWVWPGPVIRHFCPTWGSTTSSLGGGTETPDDQGWLEPLIWKIIWNQQWINMSSWVETFVSPEIIFDWAHFCRMTSTDSSCVLLRSSCDSGQRPLIPWRLKVYLCHTSPLFGSLLFSPPWNTKSQNSSVKAGGFRWGSTVKQGAVVMLTP